MAFNDSFLRASPDFSIMLRRLTWMLRESSDRAFRDMLADMFLTAICDGLNFPSVSFSDSTSSLKLLLLIRMELIRRSRTFCSLLSSLLFSRSVMNFMFRSDSLFSLARLTFEPKSWILLILIFPLSIAWISNLAENLATLTSGLPCLSEISRSSIMILFSSPKSMFPIFTSVFRTFDSSRTAIELIPCCMYGIFSKAISPK